MSYDFTEKSRSDSQPIDCYLFELGDDSWFYTSAEETLSVTGYAQPFAPATIIAERSEHGAEDQAGGIVLTVPRTFPCIADFVAYAPSSRLWVTLIQAHRDALAEVKTPFRGPVVGVEWADSSAKLTCQPITVDLGRMIPRISYARQCNWPLYSSGCGVYKATYAQAAEVITVSGVVLSAAEFATHEDGYFNAGFVEWSGQRRFVVGHVDQVITLMSPFSGLEPGLTVTAYPGCDLTETMCLQRFNNLWRHFGVARVPDRNPHTRRAF
jgi:uncharacterized phage protein (TIGR02218 family)